MLIRSNDAELTRSERDSDERSLAERIVFEPRVLRTAEDWRRLQQAKFCIELRNQAHIHQRNAESCLGAIRALMEQRDGCTDVERRAALADRLDLQSRRYDEFVTTARQYAAQADGIEAQLAAVSDVRVAAE